MSKLNEIIMEMSETVLTIKNYEDVHVTLQETEFIKNKIKELDLDFYQKLKNEKLSFSFGEKYFCPINEKHCVCIPIDSDTSEVFNLLNDKDFCKEIVSDFLHNFLFKNYLNDYFNISINNN